MRKLIMGAVIATAVAGAAIGGAGAANARAVIGFNIGDVGVGFSDGYWDHGHHWHHWRHHDDAVRFRAEHADSYHEWRHDDRHHG